MLRCGEFILIQEFAVKKHAMRTATLAAVLWAAASIAHAAAPQPITTIELSAPADVRDANILEDAITAISAKVMRCVNEKLAPPSECSCMYPAELGQVRAAYENALKAHPAWKDHVIFWWRDDTHSYSYNVSMLGLRTQVFEKPCPAAASR